MSSAVAGKFQDHYEVLGISPKTNMEGIQAVYTQLAKKYRPDNPTTGDKEKFEAVNLAYEVLSDPDLRSTFDKLKGVGADDVPKFSGPEFFDSLGREAGLRSTLLCVLYDRRRNKPYTPSLSMRHLENMLNATPEELFSALWYLKQKDLVMSDDKSNLQITIEGMDFLETNKASAEVVMPFLKPAALNAAPPKVAPPKPPPAPESEPRFKNLRAIGRIVRPPQ